MRRRWNQWGVGRWVLCLGVAWGSCLFSQAQEPDATTATALRVEGERLLSERHCVNCHRLEGKLGERIPRVFQPEIMARVSNLRPDYVRRVLSGVQEESAVGYRHRLPESADSPGDSNGVDTILAFLMPDGVREWPQSKPGYEADRDRGETHYRTLGCAACHGEDWPASPLGKALAKKYRSGGLYRFLGNDRSGHGDFGFRLELSAEEAADLARYLGAEEVPPSAVVLPSNGSGREHFRNSDCRFCHRVAGEMIPERGKLLELTALAPSEQEDRGCLSQHPDDKVPNFRLTAQERRAIRLALNGIAEGTVSTKVQELRRELKRWRCDRCHSRDGEGGVRTATDHLFVSPRADLGEEGRLPPDLTGVGRKLTREALEQTISGHLPVRPYLMTRMPGYPAEVAARLAALFVETDRDPDERPLARTVAENQVGRNMWGRALIGTEGLSCITCHELGGHPSLGIPAMDLAHAPKRLRPEWFRDYLIEPARYRPGTRMPSFWPGGQPSLKGHGGSTDRQIDSLWAYLLEWDQSRLPAGLERRGEFLLEPGERPTVFRTFLAGVGNHAVAVGFDEGVHGAFDSQDSQWQLFWRGAFLDAASTWDDRFTPLAQPEGEDVLSLPDPEAGREFLGYRLDPESGVPQFRYRIGDLEIWDELRPAMVRSGVTAFVRRIKAVSSSPQAVWIELARGQAIEMHDPFWRIDARLQVRSEAPLRQRETAGSVGLEVQCVASSNPDWVEIRWEW